MENRTMRQKIDALDRSFAKIPWRVKKSHGRISPISGNINHSQPMFPVYFPISIYTYGGVPKIVVPLNRPFW